MNNLIKVSTSVLIIQIFMALTNLIILFFISNNFGASGYGDYYLLKRAADILTLILLVGLTVSIPRNLAFYKKENSSDIIKVVVIVMPVITIVIIALLQSLILPLLIGELYNDFFLITILITFSFIIFNLINSYQRAIENFKSYNLYSFINYIFIPLFPLLLANTFLSYLYIYAVILTIFNFIVYIVVVFMFIRKGLLKSPTIFKLRYYDRLLRYGIKRFPGLVLASLIFTLPIITLNHFGMDYEKGILSQLIQLFSLIIMPINSVGTVILPRLSSIIADGQISKITKSLNRSIILFITIVSIVSITIYLLSDIYFYLLNSTILSENYNYLKYIIFAIIPFSFYSLFKNPIDAGSEKALSTRVVLISYVFSFSVFILLRMSNVEILVNIFFSMFTMFFALGISSFYYIYKIFNDGRGENSV